MELSLFSIGFLFVLVLVLYILLSFSYTTMYQPYSILSSLSKQGIKGDSYSFFTRSLRRYREFYEKDQQMEFIAEKMRKYKKEGEQCFTVQLGPSARLYLIDPFLIQQVYRGLSKQTGKSRLLEVFWGKLFGFDNLIFEDDPNHSFHRKALSPVFRHDNVKSMKKIMVREGIQAVKRWERKMKKEGKQNKTQIAVDKELGIVFLCSVVRAIFGSGMNSEPSKGKEGEREEGGAIAAGDADVDDEGGSKKGKLIAFIMAEVLRLRQPRMGSVEFLPILRSLPIFNLPRIDSLIHQLHSLVGTLIIDRKEGKTCSSATGPDLLDQLLTLKDEEGKLVFDEKTVKAQSLVFVGAGHETSALAMSWTLYCLMQNPLAMEAAKQEVDNVLGEKKTNQMQQEEVEQLMDSIEMKQLKVVESCIWEAMRLYPVVSTTSRQAREDCVLTVGKKGEEKREIIVKKGTEMYVQAFLLHRDCELFPDPELYNYKRWMGDEGRKHNPGVTNPFAYMPFAAGPRNCIGQTFAMLNMKIVCALLLHNIDMAIVPGQHIYPEMQLTLRPKYGMKAYITMRE